MNKIMIIEKETLTGRETNNFKMEEYFPFKNENGRILIGDDKLVNTKKLKIEIDTYNLDDAIEFLQECKKEEK
ncbi:hypothetical protein SKUN_00341 [Spiroplasma kunkelii CR2-3x]|uniref:Uncharacterized protein n=1 Tax=Spiroplasma kunkelii CR2-3x TaxID=273035 RepID=A0A0K2JFS5_SPIKU|nr:hypothetical protein [Spiroplasma kunkelii]ALA97257.1 hypothetical protein SKUN_00341 [Spiroplasma kunkelii CR2-3x]